MIVMAQKTVVVLVDDLDGQPADTTVRFGLDSRDYELDLTEANAQALREAFARYIPVARKTSGGRRASATAEKPAKPRSTDGLTVAERQDAPLNWEDRT